MVKKSGLLKTMVGIFLTIIITSGVYAQADKEYYTLKKYRKWGLVAGPALYNRAEIYRQYGDYTFENKPMLGFNAGFEYDFYPDRKWSFITGLVIALEPVYNVHYHIKIEDIYSHFEEDLIDSFTSYSMSSFSTPILIRLNIQMKEKVFISFLSGFKVKFFPPYEALLIYSISNEDNTESREIFGLNLHSHDNLFHGSFVIGSGISIAMKKVLLKTNFIYVMNFQNTFEGEYQFGNLLTSPPTRGDYELSGNYLGLVFTVSLAKRKDK